MKENNRSYLWIFAILLIILIGIFLLVRKDSALRNTIYDEGVIIDTNMQMEQ